VTRTAARGPLGAFAARVNLPLGVEKRQLSSHRYGASNKASAASTSPRSNAAFGRRTSCTFPATSLLPQPHGFEGFGGGAESLDSGHLAVTERGGLVDGGADVGAARLPRAPKLDLHDNGVG
jgi:hypothetical protein